MIYVLTKYPVLKDLYFEGVRKSLGAQNGIFKGCAEIKGKKIEGEKVKGARKLRELRYYDLFSYVIMLHS